MLSGGDLVSRPFSAPSNPHARRHLHIRARAAKTFHGEENLRNHPENSGPSGFRFAPLCARGHLRSPDVQCTLQKGRDHGLQKRHQDSHH